MNKYKWDILELRDNCEKLKEMLRYEKSEIKQENINDFISLYNTMQLITYNRCSQNNVFDYDLDGNNYDYLINDLFSYYDTKEKQEIMALLINAYDILKSSDKTRNLYNPVISINNDELLGISSRFYREELPSQVYKDYLDIFNGDSLNIGYSKNPNDFGGVNLFDPFLRKKYINVTRSNRLVDLVLIPHEAMHYLVNDYSAGISTGCNSDFLDEIEGSFINLLFSKWYSNITHHNEDFFKNYFIYYLDYQIGIILFRTILLNAINDDKSINYEGLNKLLEGNGIEKIKEDENIVDYLTESQDYYIKYALSTLCAVDLFYLYDEDRNHTIDSIKKIRNTRGIDDIIPLLKENNVTFMNDDYKNLKKFIQN